MRWEEKYRPKKFGKVWGQDHAVAQLSGLILNGNIEKHIALLGQVGSGKTSLVDLFATGLNCSNQDGDGSPCGTCESCSNPVEYLHAYDTAGRSGAKDDVLDFARAKGRRFGISRTQVVFFDEAHRLSREAQDGLLIFIEKAPPGIIVCVATTESRNLRPAFLSRFLDIEIRPLAPDTAFAYLQSIADQENVEIDPSALRLMVAALPPQARDLIVALEGLSHLNQRIDVELVKKHLDLGVCDHLTRYMKAVADGDRANQLRALAAWKDNPIAKRRVIESFVAEVYFNDVIGERYVIDPLIHHLAEARQSFMRRLMARHSLNGQTLIAAFEQMMEFWSSRKAEGESGANLSIALFGALVDTGLTGVGQREAPLASRPTHSFVSAIDPPANNAPEARASRRPRFLNEDDLRQIINYSSFFVQHYGRTMNATARINIARAEPDLETGVERAVDALTAKMKDVLAGGLFASVATIERDGAELAVRLVAHVEEDLLKEFEMVCTEGLPFRSRDIKTDNGDGGMAFHLNAIRELCAGCLSELSPADEDLRQKIGILKGSWRHPGPTDCRRLFFSDLLTSNAIDAACFPYMGPLLAIESGAYKWALAGWELREHPDRRIELQSRLDELASLARLWRDDPEVRDQQVRHRLETWHAIPPERRVRAWKGW